MKLSVILSSFLKYYLNKLAINRTFARGSLLVQFFRNAVGFSE